MRINLFLILVVAAFSVGCVTTEVAKESNSSGSIDLASATEVVLTVHGLSCPLCSTNLDGQLQEIDGVESAVIDLNTGQVTVGLAAGHSVSEEDFAQAVEGAGFTLKSIDVGGGD